MRGVKVLYAAGKTIGQVRVIARSHRRRFGLPLLVVDLSGSMDGEKIALARKSAITYAEALEKNMVPFAVAGFTVQYGSTLNPKETVSCDRYRNYPLDLYIFKDFDTSLKRAKGGIGCITSEAVNMGDNADGDSLLQLYWNMLKPRKSKRKIMIVFSDGAPAARGGNQGQRLRDVTAYIEGEGVDLVGVGILSSSPAKYYKKHTIINKVGDLAKESLQQLDSLLIDPKFKVDNSTLMGVTEKLRGK
jgi:cobalamin biosynthesis protein CobT